MHEVDAVVCGAGVVGLAIGRALALAGYEVLVLEREMQFGTGTSSRNSEVIHAGIYYPEGSLKSRLCVAGRHQLYRFCEDHHVPHRRIGKLIVATTAEQLPKLAEIRSRALRCGVQLAELDERRARSLEPELSCSGALLSDQTGIIDSHAYMQALLGSAENHGATLICGTDVSAVKRRHGLWQICLPGEDSPVIATPLLVNAAGLGSQSLASRIEALDPAYVPPLHLARGNYFAYAGRIPFRRLIYPVPEPGGLGTHLTLSLNGAARFGPDVEWIEKIDYRLDPRRHAGFVSAAKKLWPSLDPARLHPDFTGIRPKLRGPAAADADFMIQGPDDHGLSGLINLFGIESPGLTASLAIADFVHNHLVK